MKKILIICLSVLLLQLLFFNSIGSAKTYGPLWAIWTHSKDKDECQIKTAFWFALSTVTFIYLIDKTTKKDKQINLFPSIFLSYVEDIQIICTLNFRF